MFFHVQTHCMYNYEELLDIYFGLRIHGTQVKMVDRNVPHMHFRLIHPSWISWDQFKIHDAHSKVKLPKKRKKDRTLWKVLNIFTFIHTSQHSLSPPHGLMPHTNQHKRIPRPHSRQHYTIMVLLLDMLPPPLSMPRQTPPGHTLHPRSANLSQASLHPFTHSKNKYNWIHLL